ncbi:autotransporter outer membrane beta-barrel domain-containing protein [Budvicia aquatica]|uniref:Outer membrane autotransporter barrel domain-containing protein n=1 Tax=Budvicia aquatica TaxID=82979 RepID=A0A2C6DJN2_9GAMM|nr:autotransporter outer membrane beta-barrel domain-containing protein [Budvicia aquatica]PHI29031.1 outer membrane autotransporter barrel domain-containing protein [Budvicia aquatica]
MNHIYKIVWNKGQQCWCVVSELAKGHIKAKASASDSRVVQSLALAILLGMAAMPALSMPVTPALIYDDETISAGESQTIDDGDTAQNTIINQDGKQFIKNGGIAKKTVIAGGGQYLYGGDATDTTINNNGLQEVRGGGTSTDTLIDGGKQFIYTDGAAKNTTIKIGGSQSVYGGGIATNSIVNGGAMAIYGGGIAQDTIINSGSQTVAASSAINTVVYEGGTQHVMDSTSSGAPSTVENTLLGKVESDGSISKGGVQKIRDGGAAKNTTIYLSGKQEVYIGGTATNTTIKSGTQIVNSGATVIETTIDDGKQYVYGDGTATNSTVNDDGQIRISDSGILSGITQINGSGKLVGIDTSDNIIASVNIINNSVLMLKQSADTLLNLNISGAGSLIKLQDNTLTLTGTNTFSGDVDIQGGIVAISADTNLGSTTNQVLLNGGDLQITADLTSGRNAILRQTGRIIVDSDVTASINGWDDGGLLANTVTKTGDGTLIWTGNNSANTATVNITGGTLQIESLAQLASAAGVVDLGAAGTLSILKSASSAANVDFTRQLTGSGELKADLGDPRHEFTFNSSANGGNFTGTLTVDNGRFILNADADSTLGNATLVLNGSAGKLGTSKLEGSHILGGLTLNGGQLEVDYSAVDYRPNGFLTVNTLNMTGGGNLAIRLPSNLANPLPVTGESLFDQDDNVYDQIIAATTVNGDGTQLVVTQVDGTPMLPDTSIGLVQNNIVVGEAYYNYFGSVKSDGLYLGYGLAQLEAFAGQSIILTNSNATDNKLGARLTGDGGFTLNANGTVHIGNAASHYTGATDINSGAVVLITDNGFGQTSALNMQSGTAVDLNGNNQTIGQLNALTNSQFDFNGGALTITNGGQLDGMLTGQGQMTLTNGTLSVTQNNGQLTSATNINSGAIAHLTQPQGLGRGIIRNEGILNLDTARGTLLNSLKGRGEVRLINGADIWLNGNNIDFDGRFTTDGGTTLTATTAVNLGNASVDNAGTLVLDNAGLWALTNNISGVGSLVKRGTGTIQIDGSNVSAGLTDIESGMLIIGGLPASSTTSAVAMPLADSYPANLTSDVIIRESATLGGYGVVTGNIDNQGNLILGHSLTGAGHGKFIIDGNYTGSNNGAVIFNTHLDGDSSLTDRLVITGNASGNSKLIVLSARGEGAQTGDGIKLIDVQGSDSSGKFTLSGRAVAGAYEYFLYQGAVSAPDDGDWYLRSSLNSLNPDPSIYRPEAGGYMANMAAAGNLFNLRLQDREGRAENSSLWLRQVGSRTKHRDDSGQLHTSTNSYVIQGGGEVFGTDTSDTGRVGVGLMVAYGKADSKSGSRTSGYKADSSIDGYSTGLYGTWYQDAKTLNGAYVDSWVQYSWLDAQVNGQDKMKESYNIDGLSASVEAGYRLPIYQGLNGDVFITPQGQIIWNGITADDHTENGGTKVSSSGHDNVQTRLGVKVSRDGINDKDKATDKLFTVYAEANWLHNSQQAGAILDGTEIKQSGSRNLGELKLGTEGQLNQNLGLWTNVAQQLGDNGYSNTSVNLGVKVRF